MIDKPNPYIETYTGKKFYVLNPQPEDISIIDIAHALSMMCRYTGHVRRFFSVSEHSILVSKNSPNNELFGLLHDASEAYLSDIASPIKPYLSNYKELETNLMAVICDKFGLPREMPEEVHIADKEILRVEAAFLVPSKGYTWECNHDLKKYPIWTNKDHETIINCYSPEQAKLYFLERFSLLQNQ